MKQGGPQPPPPLPRVAPHSRASPNVAADRRPAWEREASQAGLCGAFRGGLDITRHMERDALLGREFSAERVGPFWYSRATCECDHSSGTISDADTYKSRCTSSGDQLSKRGPGSDALQGKGPRRPPHRRLERRLEEVDKAVGGGCCRLQMPFKLAGDSGWASAGRPGGGGREGAPPPLPMHPWGQVSPLALPCGCQSTALHWSHVGTSGLNPVGGHNGDSPALQVYALPLCRGKSGAEEGAQRLSFSGRAVTSRPAAVPRGHRSTWHGYGSAGRGAQGGQAQMGIRESRG